MSKFRVFYYYNPGRVTSSTVNAESPEDAVERFYQQRPRERGQVREVWQLVMSSRPVDIEPSTLRRV